MGTMIKKSQMMTLILCSDRDFKHRAVNFLNNVAFQSEKIPMESFQEAKDLVDRNPFVLNAVIEGALFKEKAREFWPIVLQMAKKPNFMCLIYFPDGEGLKAFPHKKPTVSNIFLKVLPFVKGDFIEAFHTRIESGSPSKPQPIQDAASQQQKSITIEEATSHLFNTIEQVRALSQDRTKLESLFQIGQRFNGVMGAFAFLQTKLGMPELKRLSIIIDSVARTYETQGLSPLTKEHHELILSATRCAYRILVQLRQDPTALSPELVADENRIFTLYEKDTILLKRNSHSQDQVDELLKNLAS